MFSFITGVIAKSGLLGVALLMLLENLLPIIPSELILPLAGFQAARGQFDPVAAIVAGTAGSLAGGFVWYLVGRTLGVGRLQAFAQRGGRWFPVTPGEVGRANAWFCRWGALAVCVGRALPGIRGVICIPAGLARMSPLVFLIASGIGAFAWSDVLVSSGYALRAHYAVVEGWLNPLADGLFGLVLLLYLYRVLRARPQADG